MKKGLTDITAIVDKSGSMSSIKTDAEGGMNQFIEEQQAVDGEAVFSLVQFSTAITVDYIAKPMKDVPKMELRPSGCTALLDAIGTTIANIGTRLAAMDESERPEKVMVVVMTDGEENSSIEYTKTTVNEMIKTQQDVYNWEFIFLAANQDAIQEGAKMGFMSEKSMTFVAGKAGVENTFGNLSKHTTAYRTVDNYATSFTAEDRSSSMSTDD